MKIKNVIKLSKVEEKKLVENQEISKSQKIKTLFNSGDDIKTIAAKLSIRYNFAYNVISNYINIESVEVIKEEKINKKSKIIELYLENKSHKEISIELKTNYNYVFNTIKAYKSEQDIKKESTN